MKTAWMKEWIRWPGLIAFGGTVALIAAVFYLLADKIVETTIEQAGTAAAGARVELDGADLSLFPAGIRLTGLQVTDPDAPMKNALEAGRIEFSLDLMSALQRKIIVREMAVEAVRFNTPRKTSGAVRPAAGAGEKGPAGDRVRGVLSARQQDISSILKQEVSVCLDQCRNLEADIQKEKQYFKDRIQSLPDEKAFDGYEQRVKALKNKKGLEGLLSGISEAVALQKDIQKDVGQIEQTRRELKEKVTRLNDRFQQLARCPQEEARRIRNKYSSTPEGMGNITGLVLGERYSLWAERILAWYARLSPLLERRAGEDGSDTVKPLRGRGVNVRFKEQRPVPDFLIEKARVTVIIPAGDISGTLQNLTPDQPVLGRPLSGRFAGDRLNNLDSVTLSAVLNRTTPGKPEDILSAEIRGYPLNHITLSDNPDIPLALEYAKADISFDGTVREGRLKMAAAAQLSSVKVSPGRRQEADPMARAVYEALRGVSDITIKAVMTGTVDQYDIRLSSNLDRIIKDVVLRAAKQKLSELEAKIGKELSLQTREPLKALQGSLGGFDLLEKELSDRLRAGRRAAE